MVKTTVYLDPSAYQRLKHMAGAREVAPAVLIREAIAAYTAKADRPPMPRSIGAFRSGRHDLGERAEEELAGFGED
jgi:hypothetical protein